MPQRDPRVDRYIEDAADFAQPILRHLRDVVHKACPDVEEGLRWGRPHFDHHGILCGMAAFKAHCTFGFWNDRVGEGDPRAQRALERLGRLTTLKDVPPKKALVSLVEQAAKLNEEGVKPRWTARRKAAEPRPELPVPEELAAALKLRKNAKARAAFEGFSPSHRREYVEWIAEAKRDETRARRVEQTLAWLAEGKPRNWKYV